MTYNSQNVHITKPNVHITKSESNCNIIPQIKQEPCVYRPVSSHIHPYRTSSYILARHHHKRLSKGSNLWGQPVERIWTIRLTINSMRMPQVLWPGKLLGLEPKSSDCSLKPSMFTRASNKKKKGMERQSHVKANKKIKILCENCMQISEFSSNRINICISS